MGKKWCHNCAHYTEIKGYDGCKNNHKLSFHAPDDMGEVNSQEFGFYKSGTKCIQFYRLPDPEPIAINEPELIKEQRCKEQRCKGCGHFKSHEFHQSSTSKSHRFIY